MGHLARALRNVVIPLVCLGVGVLVGHGLRSSMPAAAARGMSETREGGYRYVNPLLECERGGDPLQVEELTPFRSKVEAYLRRDLHYPGVDSVSVYFRELNDGIWFSIGETERFTPASLRKVPMLIAVLKQAERAPHLLTTTVPFRLATDHNAWQNFKPSVTMIPGQSYTVAELLRRMIVYSDNNAFMLLSERVDPRELGRTYEKLAVSGGRQPSPSEFLSVQTYASFFRILYNASYLGKDLSESALDMLAQTEFRNGIVAGLPPGTPVAHKFGEVRDGATGAVQLHDCGIVYFPGRPYLLCIMSRGTSFEYLDDAIASISRVIATEMAAQRAANGVPGNAGAN